MNTTQENNIFNILKYNLSNLLPLRVVLRKVDDKFQGLCEDSFSMSYSDNSVYIWWSGKAYSIIGEHLISGIDDAQHNSKPGDIIFDPLSDECPIEIDWEKWINAENKYSKRNVPFKMKEKK